MKNKPHVFRGLADEARVLACPEGKPEFVKPGRIVAKSVDPENAFLVFDDGAVIALRKAVFTITKASTPGKYESLLTF